MILMQTPRRLKSKNENFVNTKNKFLKMVYFKQTNLLFCNSGKKTFKRDLKATLQTLLMLLTTSVTLGQFTTDEITYGNRFNLENSNSWAIGAGVSNFIMHGDLRSLGTNNLGNFYNVGGYVYVDKMFNPLLGLEFKATYSQLSGGSQYLSDIYQVLYVPDAVIRNGVSEAINRENLFFEGRAYGAELNLILSISNLYQTSSTKWHAAGYFGIGYHIYNSALYEKLDDGTNFKFDGADFGSNSTRNSENSASSIYLSAQFGIKRKISNRIDIEARTGMYFNYEDHLDATISNKQDWETFFVTSIGITVKLGKKKVFTIWGTDNKNANNFKIIDTDKDGVMDLLDTDPNTPVGVMVYGNGSPVDADKDGLPDYKDKCAFEYGPLSNEGCPTLIDTDGDGVMDGKDLCPNKAGMLENNGCPKQKAIKNDSNTINQQIAFLATNIYFETNSNKIMNISFNNLDKIVTLMKNTPKILFEIEGHTDNRNSERYNMYLSQKRAATIRKYIIKQGISSKRLKSIGYGENRPRYSNENAGGRQLNRRVEIKAIAIQD
jgi:outer membrane protein OmpA-like peptidoglycan-associated protein